MTVDMNAIRGRNFQLLNQDQIQAIHFATLEILQTVGVKVLHEGALRLFADVGATVDFGKQWVKISPPLIEEWIKKAPSGFKLYARDESNHLELKEDVIHYTAAHTTPFVYDLDTGVRRPATYQDAQHLSKLSDSLELIADAYGMVYPRDVPDHAAHAYILMAQINNSNKVLKGRVNGGHVARDCIEMAEMVAGGEGEMGKKPNLYVLANCVSPLTLETSQIEGLIEYASRGLPVIIASEILAGGTGPITLAGTLVQQNAEVLSHIMLVQMVRPGAPVIYGSASSVMDMKNSNLRYGAVEQGMIDVAVTQLARYYGIPSRVSAGVTDSKMLDMQAGYESALNLLFASLAGPNIISYSAGGLDLAMSICYEKVVIDHEIIGSIVRTLRGITVDQECLAIEAIKSIGPGGQFLTHRHTFDNFRRELFIPELANTEKYTLWAKQDQKDIKERAKERVKHILEKHSPPVVDPHLLKELKRFVKTVEQRS